MTSPQMEKAIREIQDALVVIGHIEKKQSEYLLELLTDRDDVTDFRRRTEENLAEITDKLNGLIGYIDAQKGRA